MPIPHLQVWTQPKPRAEILYWRLCLFLTFRYGPSLNQGLQSSAGDHAYSIPHLQVWTQPDQGAAILCWRARLFLAFRYEPNLNQGLQSSAGLFLTFRYEPNLNWGLQTSAGGHTLPWPSFMDYTWPRGQHLLLEVTPCPHFSYGLFHSLNKGLHSSAGGHTYGLYIVQRTAILCLR